MVTFSADFLHNQLGGITWSPGLNYIPPNSTTPSLVKNRSYYTLDAGVEPYLPKGPGEHGAKLTAFFNTNPSDIYEEAEEDSFDETPLFACATPWATEKDQRRYVYFGNYSQTRWSDKLDYDRMIECVPAHVKQYWAEELAAKGRPKWVTEALMKHFWPKPVYDGAITVPADDSDDKMMRDIKFYITELKAWEKEARLKVNLIKKEDILKAFDTADADDPPALRLWWEYLQCAGWDKNFYDMLVTLQARNKNYF
ncbi:hypothetical protein P154DRAFT_431291 [Amniculicola lignicola CBS 123094]|uniref:DUF6697 domain-containing protein n=1 Tax=Amniculicola lignicola CBS 123094 TaxID=1392246 RepID=A0A6A5WK40_9PLEO|nr:hypothetical protein P154DRAFT_431291 [Amniculicola lignicola CBS 123094]